MNVGRRENVGEIRRGVRKEMWGVSVYMYIPAAGIAMDPTGSINWRSSLFLCTVQTRMDQRENRGCGRDLLGNS